jgi:hypothetical protein
MTDQYYGESELRTYQTKQQITSLTRDCEGLRSRIASDAAEIARLRAALEVMLAQYELFVGPDDQI